MAWASLLTYPSLQQQNVRGLLQLPGGGASLVLANPVLRGGDPQTTSNTLAGPLVTQGHWPLSTYSSHLPSPSNGESLTPPAAVQAPAVTIQAWIGTRCTDQVQEE